MTSSGDPSQGASGVNEPDWIDQILERATRQVDGLSSEDLLRPDEPETPVAKPLPRPAQPPQRVPAPVLPESIPPAAAVPPPTAPVAPQPAPVQAASAEPHEPARAQNVTDELAAIQWADARPVTPASTPIVGVEPVLTAESVGRSAWDDDLRSIGQTEPEGWDKLSWQDLDENPRVDNMPVVEPTTTGQLLREWGPVLFAAIAIALFVRLVLVQAYHIPSTSMVPTLETGDRVVVNRQSYQFGEVERGQVVVFEKPRGSSGENDLIKRIIGLPGETIRFYENEVYINDLRVEEPYLAAQDSTRPRLTIPNCAQTDAAPDMCLIPEGYVFVMGDNRLGSSDSRVFGPIPADTIVGRAFMRVWPLNDLGGL